MSNLSEGVDLITKEQLSDEQRKAVDLVLNKKQNLFVHGQAGSGKSTFIKYLQLNSDKNIVLCAPTGVAALNVNGVTLHSLFRLPIVDFITDESLYRMNRKNVKNVIQAIDILIIDEVSMVRPDMLDGVDKICRKIRRCSKKPFGGIQTILIGDLYQLPPVIKKDSLQSFNETYGTTSPYFFDANVYKQGKFKSIQFTTVFRQKDKTLLNNLIKIRTKTDIYNAITYFNSCKITDKQILDNCVTITPYKAIAEEINKRKLAEIKKPEHIYMASMTGTFEKFNENNYPAQKELKLKEGALVMFIRNNQDKQWVNGTVGIIEKLNDVYITVKLISNNQEVLVARETWEDVKYIVEQKMEVNTITGKITAKEYINKKIVGTFNQFPLQLGYGLTIHRAQGKTLDKVNIDLNRGAFAHGQLYVALSRTQHKEDINLVHNIHERDIIFDPKIQKFLEDMN